MAKNRRNESGAFRFNAAVTVISLLVIFGAAAVGFLWQKNQITELGRQIKKNEIQLAEVRRQNRIRRDQIDHLRSPAVLEQRVKDLRLGLLPPQPGQIITLVESVPPSPPASQGRHLVAVARQR